MSTETETEVLDPLAAEIRDRHLKAETLVEKTKGAIGHCLEEKLACAALVETARAKMGGAKFWDFWRGQVTLADDAARHYLTLHKAKGRAIDKAQLHLIGIIEKPEQEQPHNQRTPDPFAWAKHFAKGVEQLTHLDTSTLTDSNRSVFKKTIEDKIAELEGVRDKL